jgi:putative iron-only hydrogenase system regulator
MNKRVGCIAIIIQREQGDVSEVNHLLSQFGEQIIGRMGLPYPDRGVNIITLIVDAPVETFSALTGKLGKLPGVQVRSLMTKEPKTAG